jgi:hypothetical protein
MHALFGRIHVVFVEETAGKDQKLSITMYIVKRAFLADLLQDKLHAPQQRLASEALEPQVLQVPLVNSASGLIQCSCVGRTMQKH